MAALADLLFYISLALFCAGVLPNIRYIFSLPRKIPRNARWPVMIWLVMLAGLASWFSHPDSVASITSVDSSAMIQIASIAVAGMTMVLVAGSSYDARNLRFPFVMLLIFGVVGALTAPLSPFPALSFFKASSV